MQHKQTAKRWLKVASYFGYTMVLFYLAFGLCILFTGALQEIIARGALRTAFGVLLILYSIFRAFRVYKKIKCDENQ